MKIGKIILLALVTAVFTILIAFWPMMLVLGGLHSYLPWVPAIGWQPSMLFVLFCYLVQGCQIKGES